MFDNFTAEQMAVVFKHTAESAPHLTTIDPDYTGDPDKAAQNGLILIELVPIDSVFRDPANINEHDEEGLHEIAQSLVRFGQRTPITVNQDGMILKGNGTHEALQRLGRPNVWITRWTATEEEQISYAVADNATGRLSKFKRTALRDFLKLRENTPGIDPSERAAILAEEKIRPADETAAFSASEAIAANPDATRVRYGDLWKLGDHYLLCGDCADPEHVAAVMEDAKTSLIATDPPYGVDAAGKNAYLNERDGGSRCEEEIEADQLEHEPLRLLIHNALKNGAAHSTRGATAYLCAPQGDNLIPFLAAWTGTGFDFRWQLVWVKDNKNFGRSDYHFQHENILFGWKHKEAHWFKKRGVSSVFQAPKPLRSTEHVSMKPIELMRQIIDNSSRPGDVVYDPFGGSGTTLLACEGMGRFCRTIEIKPQFAEVIVARWEAEIGQTPEFVRNIIDSPLEEA